MNAGDIKVALVLENGSFRVEMQKAGVLIKAFQKNLEDTGKSVKAIEDHTNSFSSRLRYAITSISLARGALVNLNDIFLGFPRAVANASGEIEKMQTLMAGLAKSSKDVVSGNKTAAESAKEWTGFVFDMSKNAPFQVNAITDSFVKLKTAGLDPTDGSLKALVDSVAKYGGSSEMLKRASVAIQQMGGKGVISMEELRQQLGEAVPDAMQLMARGVGLSMAELVKKISLGQVESTSALKKMFTIMRIENDGAASAMVNTWTGQIEKLKTNFTLFLNDVGNAGGENSFFAEIKKQLKEINEMFDGNEAKRFAADLGSSMKSIASGVGATIRFIREYGTEIKNVALAVGAFFVVQKGISVVSSGVDKYKAITAALAQYKMASADLTAKLQADARTQLAQQIASEQASVASEARAAKEKETIARAHRTKMLAEEAQYRAMAAAAQEISTTGRRPTGNGAQTVIASNALREQKRQEAISYMQVAVAAEKSAIAQQVAIKETQLVHAGAMAAMRANSVAAADSMAKIGTTATDISKKIPIMGTLMTALGGPIGIITTLVTAGAFAWFQWGSKAKAALEEVNNAIRDGEARNADVLTLGKQIEAQKKVIAAIDFNKSFTGDSKDLSGQSLSDKLAKENARLVELQKQQVEAKRQASMNEVADSVRRNQKLVELDVNAVKTRQAERLAALSAAYSEEVTQLKNSGKSVVEAKKKNDADYKAILTGSAQQQVEILTRNANFIQTLIDKSEGQKKAGYEAQFKNIKRLADEAKAQALDVSEIGSADLIGGKTDKAAKVDKLQAFMNTLKEAKIELDSTKQSLLSGSDAVRKYIDSFNVEVATGKLKGFGAAAIESARNLALSLDVKKTEVDALQKLSDTYDKAKSKVIELRAEQNKQGPQGQILQMQAALDDYIKNSPSPDQGAIGKFKDQIIELQNAVNGGDIADKIRSTETAIAALEERANGGSSAVGRLALDIKRLTDQTRELGAAADPKDIAELQRLIELSAKLQGVQSEDVLRDVRAATRAKQAEVQLSTATEAEAIRLRYEQEARDIEKSFADKKVYGAAEIEYAELKEAQLKAIRDKAALDSRSPAERMVQQWQDATARMREASANWTNDSIDRMVNMAKTGKFEFGDMIESMLTDILKITYQKQLGGSLQTIFDGIANGVGGALKGNNAGAPEGATPGFNGALNNGGILDTAKGALDSFAKALGFGKEKTGELSTSVAGTVAQTVLQTSSSSTATGSMVTLAQASAAATQAITSMATAAASSSGGSSGGGFFGYIPGAIGGLFGGGSASSAASSSASGGFVASDLMTMPAFFANGGIMSSGGALNLRKYANGGIANSPQLALYGEGSMNEAFVPLPDGRSIPVTMRGGRPMGGGSNVVVNVINNASGTQAREERKQNADGSMSIDVIIEQVEGKISKNVASGRGSLSGVMEKTYGLNRASGAY